MIENNTPLLHAYTTDLASLADEGKLDPVIGRNIEIEKLIEVLCQRENNNAVLTGNRDVKKIAIVEGLAQRISSGNIPDTLLNKRIRQLDWGYLIYKSQYRTSDELMLRFIQQLSQYNSILFINDPNAFGYPAFSLAVLPQNFSSLLKTAIRETKFLCIFEMLTSEFEIWQETDPIPSHCFQSIQISELHA